MAGVDRDRVWAGCVGVPGIVDASTGDVRLSSSMPSIQGTGLARRARRSPRRRVTSTTTSSSRPRESSGAALRTCSPRSSSIEWGERVGAGLLLNGSLYRGASNDSGDLGFLDLSVGPRCGYSGPTTGSVHSSASSAGAASSRPRDRTRGES